jgi:hypothetical protein
MDLDDCGEAKEAHVAAIADLREAIATASEGPVREGDPPRADVLFLNAQLIRHRISLALIDSRLTAFETPDIGSTS